VTTDHKEGVSIVTWGGKFALFVLVLFSIPAPARAHGDVPLAAETLVLSPGAQASFTGELHYHRLVGRVTADGQVTVRLVDAERGATRVSAGPGTSLSLNTLVRCCDRVWAPHVLVVENVGADAVTVDVDAVLVHDDLAVMVDRAESGVAGSVVIMGVIWVVVLQRSLRHRQPGSLRAPIAIMTVLTGLVAGGVLFGTARFGSWGPPALVAMLADVPVIPLNPLVSRSSLLLGAAILSWGWAGSRWARVDPDGRRGAWLALGFWLLGAVVVTAVAVSTAYQGAGIPTAMAAAFAGPVFVVSVIVASGRLPRRREVTEPI
jgi:hypothetical protein